MAPRIGIRREDKNVWERRAPLTPEHVARLREEGLEVWVQPSEIRVFPDAEYEAAGARVEEDLSPCPVVLAVKEIPTALLREGQAYVFFAHVAKGQPHNMPLLRTLVERRCTLLDYEKITDDQGRRLVFFGRHAGVAGMIETLHTLGRRLEWEGLTTPFARLRRPLEYPSLAEARADLERVGQEIAAHGLPEELAPLVMGFPGYGNVSQGAQEIFDLLPHRDIRPRDLESFMASGEHSTREVCKVVFREEDLATPRAAGASFDLAEYYQHPERYVGIFDRYLPHLTVLVSCIYWDERYPRLVSREWLREQWAGGRRPRLRVIGDITCDVEGAVECTLRATEPGNPIYVYHPAKGTASDGWVGEGPVVMAVDTLPSELPREASESFGEMLLPFVPAIARADFGLPFDEIPLPGPAKRAVLLRKGEFTPDYRYMADFLKDG